MCVCVLQRLYRRKRATCTLPPAIGRLCFSLFHPVCVFSPFLLPPPAGGVCGRPVEHPMGVGHVPLAREQRRSRVDWRSRRTGHAGRHPLHLQQRHASAKALPSPSSLAHFSLFSLCSFFSLSPISLVAWAVPLSLSLSPFMSRLLSFNLSSFKVLCACSFLFFFILVNCLSVVLCFRIFLCC